jgi:hypothetical protein
MARPVNYRNKPVSSHRINKDGLNGWRLITPRGEYQYRTYELAREALANAVNVIDVADYFLCRLPPTECERTNRYVISEPG